MPRINRNNEKRIIPISKALQISLSKNKRLWADLARYHPTLLKSDDIDAIKMIGKQGEKYLKQQYQQLVPAWQKYIKFLIYVATYGEENRRHTIAAMLLAGAAICRPDLVVLREDLDISIKQAREQYMISLSAGRSGDVVDDGSISGTTGNVFADQMVYGYKLFFKKMKTGGALDIAIRKLLMNTDKVLNADKVLRVGYSLHTLSLGALAQANATNIINDKIFNNIGNTELGNDTISGSEKAPSYFKLKPYGFYCRELNDSCGNDLIFWTAYFSSIENLNEVYKMIDDAVKSGSTENLQLQLGREIKYKLQKWETSKTECEHTENIYPISMETIGSGPNGELRICQGFFPWSFSAVCTEDDNNEYEAVSDVVDTVGDYAGYVSQGASITASVSGPTPVAAGAAIVGTVATVVSLACDITEAVIDIVNYFDENDTIGYVQISGNGDYINHATNPSPIPVNYPTSDGNSGGLYELSVQEIYTVDESVTRTWRCFTQTKYSKEEKHAGILGCGNSGESDVEVTFTRPMDFILSSEINKKSAHGNVIWINEPVLNETKKKATGKVHWGVDLNHTVTFETSINGIAIFK